MNGGGHRERRLAGLVAGLVVLLLAYACAATGALVPFSTVAKGLSSGIGEPLQAVVRDPTEWSALWARHARVSGVPASPPPVSFAREMIVALFMGERATGGYTIEVVRVERGREGLVVRYRSRSPAPDAVVSQALTQPFHVIRLSRDAKPVTFVQEGPS